MEMEAAASNPHPIKEFSYDVLKSIVKYSKMEKREQMTKRIPALRKIDTKLAHHYDEVSFNNNYFKVEIGSFWRKWGILPPRRNEGIPHQLNVIPSPAMRLAGALPPLPPGAILYQTDRERADVASSLHYQDSNGTNVDIELNMTQEMAREKLLRKYLRKGSKTKVLKVSFMERVVNVDLIHLEAKHLIMGLMNTEPFNDFKPMFMDIPYKEGWMWAGETCREVYLDPVTQSFQKLLLKWSDWVPADEVDEWVLENPHKELEILHSNFPKDKLQVMMKNWEIYRRPLGTSFSMPVKELAFITEVIDKTVEIQKAVRSKFPDTEITNCATVPIDEKRELVVFGVAIPEDQVVQHDPVEHAHGYEYGNTWILNIKMLETGTTVPQ